MWGVEVYQECGRYYVMQTLAMVWKAANVRYITFFYLASIYSFSCSTVQDQVIQEPRLDNEES